ncbi:MAG: hypothetical protein JFR24_08980 [Muribaculaceae bacterium]|jgi:hypothetical protein|nr:hypothetical protein [Muribaculaceae bacterium]
MTRNLIFLFASTALCSCGGNPMDRPHSSAAIDSAAAYGQRDAAQVADSTATPMQREAAILAIRHKEAHMRAMGYEKAADAYIKAAKEIIPDSMDSKKQCNN